LQLTSNANDAVNGMAIKLIRLNMSASQNAQ